MIILIVLVTTYICGFRTAALQTTAWHRCLRNIVCAVLVLCPPAAVSFVPAPRIVASATNSKRCANMDGVAQNGC